MKTTATRSQKKPAGIVPAGPTHQEISARAESLWLKRGRPQGADQDIWLEAELQLRSGAERLGDGKGALSGLKPSSFKSDRLMADLEDIYPGPTGRETTSL